MANTNKYLVVFYCVSAGQNGPDLGSDEEEIVLLVYWVIDLHSNQVSFFRSNCFHLEWGKHRRRRRRRRRHRQCKYFFRRSSCERGILLKLLRQNVTD